VATANITKLINSFFVLVIHFPFFFF